MEHVCLCPLDARGLHLKLDSEGTKHSSDAAAAASILLLFFLSHGIKEY